MQEVCPVESGGEEMCLLLALKGVVGEDAGEEEDGERFEEQQGVS